MVALAAALFLYIFSFDRPAGEAPPRPAGGALLPGLDATAVTRIEIVTTQETLRVERTGTTWQLTLPVVYPAEPAAIDRFLALAGQLRQLSSIPAKDLSSQPRGLGDFGLQPPHTTLKFQQRTGALELRIGSQTPVGGQLYCQLGGSEGVQVIGASFLDHLPKSASDWRNRDLFNLGGLAFNRIEVRAGAHGFEVERDPTNQLWQITKPPPTKRADNARINLITQELQKWRVHQFVSDAGSTNLEVFGLQPPGTELIFGQGTNDLLTVQFGKSPTNNPGLVYARRLSHTNIVLVANDWLEALHRPVNEFRERRLLSFNPAAVNQIEIRAEESFTLRRDASQNWRVLEPANLAADTELVRSLMESLGTLEVVEQDGFVKDVVTDFSAYGLAPPWRQYSLLNTMTNNGLPATNLLAQLGLGTNYQMDKIFARRPDENSVYAIALGESQRLPGEVFRLRDRRIWNFTTNQVTAISIRHHGQVRDLVRNASNIWSFATNSQGIINIFSLEETLYRLGQLRAETWVARGADKPARFGIAEVNHQVSLSLKTGETNQTLTVQFGRLSPLRRPYAAVLLDGEPVVFEFPQALHQDVLRDLAIPVPPATR